MSPCPGNTPPPLLSPLLGQISTPSLHCDTFTPRVALCPPRLAEVVGWETDLRETWRFSGAHGSGPRSLGITLAPPVPTASWETERGMIGVYGSGAAQQDTAVEQGIEENKKAVCCKFRGHNFSFEIIDKKKRKL